jgi:hypothetical protein
VRGLSKESRPWIWAARENRKDRAFCERQGRTGSVEPDTCATALPVNTLLGTVTRRRFRAYVTVARPA